MKKLKSISLFGMAFFYVFAGVNHFFNPDFYLPLIPPYFPKPEAINIVSGLIEIILGLAILAPSLRKKVSTGIILMLIAFIPAHIYMIQLDSCITDDFCFHPSVGWIRLLIVHPLLIGWACWHRN
jgi:uncharacterized membrane protein